MNRIKVVNINSIINQLKADGEIFEIRQTLYTKNVFIGDTIYQYNSQSGLKMAELGFIARVKKYAQSLPEDMIPIIDTSEISYIHQHIAIDGLVYDNVYEIDLNAAFWEFAKKRSYISDKLYDFGLNEVSKKARLISLGNLAKRTAIMKYNGSKFEKMQFLISDTEGIFFDVSKMTADTMSNLQFMLGGCFLFYWCDAIFVQGLRSVKIVKDYLESETLPYKIRKLTNIVKYENCIVVNDPEKGERKYTFNKPIKKQTVYEKSDKIQVFSKAKWSKQIDGCACDGDVQDEIPF